MMLVRLPVISTWMPELTVLFLHGAPPSAYNSACPLIEGRGRGSFWTEIHLSSTSAAPVAGIQNRASLLFHHPGLFIGF